MTQPTPLKIRALVKDKTLTWWGSECLVCVNATPDTMTCDNCGSDRATTALYMRGDVDYDRGAPL